MVESVKVVGYWVSPFVLRVRWALKLKGIKYEYIEEDIYNKSPLISQLNPVYKKVPVLVHDENPVPESPIILEYIDETWNNNYPLLLQDPCARADARFWAKFADFKVLDAAFFALCSEGEKQEKAVKLAIEALEMVERKLDGKSFFGGDKIGYLDLMFGFVSYWVPVWEELASVKILDSHKFPGIAAWCSNFINHDAIKAEYIPPRDEMVAYFKWRREVLIPVFASRDL